MYPAIDLGVHPGTFKNSATDAWGYVQQVQAVASSVGIGWTFLNNTTNNNGKGTSTKSGNSSSSSSSTASKGKGKQKATHQDVNESSNITNQLAQAGKTATSSMAKAGPAWQKYGYAAAGAAA
jgi:hypothetical protein